MRCTTDLIFLGTEVIPSKQTEGKIYNQVNFLDGNTTCNVLCDDVTLFHEVSKHDTLTKCHVEMDIRMGRYTSARVISIVFDEN